MNLALEQQDLYNPIDTIEGIFSRDNVSFDRRKDNELVAEVLGKWDNMLIFFAYEEHLRIVHAIAHHDVDGARYAMLSHLFTARNDLMQRLNAAGHQVKN